MPESDTPRSRPASGSTGQPAKPSSGGATSGFGKGSASGLPGSSAGGSARRSAGGTSSDRKPKRTKFAGQSRREDSFKSGAVTDGNLPRRRMNSRSIAIDALVRADSGSFANLDLPARLRKSRLEQRDKDWVTDAVYGTLRRQRYLDNLLKPHSKRPLSELDPPVRAALRVGAYQFVNGTPPHAAVMETVSATQPSAQKYVNGVLRSLGRSGPPWPESDDAGTELSYPDWIVEELTRNFGEQDARAALNAMNEPAAVTLRVNPMRGDAAAVIRELETRGGSIERGTLLEESLIIKGFGDIGALRTVRDGRASPQDQGSQAIVDLLAPQPGERILDIASAPGGKSCGAAERMGDDGLVVAADVHPNRLRLVREAAGRLQLDSIHAVAASGLAMAFLPDTFDRVLLDAPCSGLGVLRRRPEARWRVQPAQVESLAELQRSLLAAAADVVKIGGRLVYSVCTMSRDETLGVDEWAASELPQLVAIEPPGLPWRPFGRGAIILPHDAATDGMFVLVFERRE